MKYTYFSSKKGGKFHIRNEFWYNRRSTCTFSSSNPVWIALTSPHGIQEKMEWYWCDRETKKLVYHQHFLDTRDKMTNCHYDELWFPIPDSEGRYTIAFHKEMSKAHKNIWQCIDAVMNSDLITSPLNLLGYCRGMLSKKMLSNIENMTPDIEPHPDVIPQLRKRKNIVAYKEDIEHLAYNVYCERGRPGSDDKVADHIDSIIKFQNILPRVLEKYDIPYEMFSLDAGDYKKTFHLDKSLPRYMSENYITMKTKEIKDKVDKYMHARYG